MEIIRFYSIDPIIELLAKYGTEKDAGLEEIQKLCSPIFKDLSGVPDPYEIVNHRLLELEERLTDAGFTRLPEVDVMDTDKDCSKTYDILLSPTNIQITYLVFGIHSSNEDYSGYEKRLEKKVVAVPLNLDTKENKMPVKNFETQLQFTVPVANKPGQLQNITTLLTKGGVNITGIQAQVTGSSAFVLFTTPTPAKQVLNLLTVSGITAFQSSVVSVQVPNQPGALNALASFLFKQGFNVNGIYGTTNTNDTQSTIVLSVDTPNPGTPSLENALESYFGSVPVSA